MRVLKWIFYVFVFSLLFSTAGGSRPAMSIVLLLVMLIPSLLRLMSARRMSPSEMQCPNCGSTNTRITSRVDGVASSSDMAFQRSFIMPKHRVTAHRQSDSSIKRRRIAVCQQCGFDYEYITADDIKQAKRAAIRSLLIVAVISIIGIAWGASSKGRADIGSTDAQTTGIWNADYTPLEDFKYYVDNLNTITLTDYKGYDKKINIAPSYDVDGKEMFIVSLDGTFALDNITSAIIPETVSYIADNTFNSCGIKYLYLPASIQDFSGWSYFHDGEKLYYGGSEQQWQAFYDRDRADLDFKQIICKANIGELLAADKTG